MAQWSHANRTVFTKIVYYGPAFGGKTTNLESLHRITDPEQTQELLSIKTTDDRTLFFDLLPFDLGEILGYQVAMKLFTVPGQVRYDATRKVVLSGADAIVFVADSSTGRSEQNRWSLQNLRMNMRANRLDPAVVPIIYQYNKQDLPEAATPSEVAGWLGIEADDGFPAVACNDRGVVEPLMAATRAMMQRLVDRADERTRSAIDAGALADHIEKAFLPHMERQKSLQPQEESAPQADDPIVPAGEDLLENSVQTSLRLGEKFAAESARAKRLEQEAEVQRRMSDALRQVGATFDQDAIVDAALGFAAEVLGATAVSLVRQEPDGTIVRERSWDHLDDPLLAFPEGEPLLRRLVESGQPCLVEDLAAECSSPHAAQSLYGLRCAMGVPIDSPLRRCLVAYGDRADGTFERHDVRFMATLAGHLSVGLEKSRNYDELARQRDRLEQTVANRTAALERANDELREMDQTKDRFLSNLSHEMKTPLTAILSSAIFLRDYKSNAKQRAEMVEAIVSSAEASQRLLEHLFRVVTLEGKSRPESLQAVDVETMLDNACRLAGDVEVNRQIGELPLPLRVDPPSVAQAVANLIENAVKFSGPDQLVDVKVKHLRRKATEQQDWVRISVLDRGPGVPVDERDQLFQPFEQGGDLMTSKPAGTGLGLYESDTIVRQHGGDIEYIKRRGGGSEFRIHLPLHCAPASSREESVHVG